MEKEEITAKVYSLKTEKGGWLGEIVLTSDGMFAAVTDWGNFSYAWRAYGKDDSFEDFILSLNIEYFADKMQEGLSYIVHSMHSQKACHRFAEKILPALQEAILEGRLCFLTLDDNAIFEELKDTLLKNPAKELSKKTNYSEKEIEILMSRIQDINGFKGHKLIAYTIDTIRSAGINGRDLIDEANYNLNNKENKRC